MDRDEALGWGLVSAIAVGLFLGMRAGWSPRRGYAFAKMGLMAMPFAMKGAHSFWLWLRKRGS